MSLHTRAALQLEDIRADFDSFISQRNWDGANAILENLWDTGFKQEAIILGKSLAAARMNVNVRENHEPKEAHEREEEAAMERDIAIEGSADIW